MPLARCLSGHTKLRGYLRPANPEVDCTVDERVKLRLGPVTLNPNALDSLQDLCRGALDRLLRGAYSLHRIVMRLVGSCRECCQVIWPHWSSQFLAPWLGW
jgi:hypothetical protein